MEHDGTADKPTEAYNASGPWAQGGRWRERVQLSQGTYMKVIIENRECRNWAIIYKQIPLIHMIFLVGLTLIH